MKTKKGNILLGFLLAFLQIIITLVLYYNGFTNVFTNVNLGLSILALIIVFGIISIVVTKKQLKNSITFKQSFTAYFTTIATSAFLMLLFNFMFFNYFLPDKKVQAIKKEMLVYYKETLKKNNGNETDILTSDSDVDSFNPFSFGMSFQSAIKYLLRDCLFGFIFAFVLRNHKLESN